MERIIAAYLVQKKECNLPGIGNFKINTVSPGLDLPNKIMFPPATEIVFSESDVHLRKDLVKYISVKQNVDEQRAAEDITMWCHNVTERLNTGEKIIFESIGTLQKNAAGNIFLRVKKETNLFAAVPAERVIHENEEHAILVGDREITFSIKGDNYKPGTLFKRKVSWKIWAIVIFAVSFLLIIIHFSYHSFTTQGLGNQVNISPAEPPVLRKGLK